MDKHQETIQTLRDLVIDGNAAPRGKLPTERELCSMMGVGRRRLRRALDALETDGLIVRQQGRGTFLANADPRAGPLETPTGSTGTATVAELADHGARALWLARSTSPVEQIELKFLLEPVMASLAATRASLDDIERLRRASEATAAATNGEDYEAADRQFHHLISELCRNALFQALHEGVSEALRDIAVDRFGENGHCFKRVAEHVAFHRRIVAAIQNRNPDEAAREMHAHLADVHQSLLSDNLPSVVGHSELNYRKSRAGGITRGDAFASMPMRESMSREHE